MAACPLSPPDKKRYGKAVGEILVRKHGKRKYYSPEQVKKASEESRYGLDWHCWALSLYSSPADFKAYHGRIGEACDYASMRAEMATALTDGASDAWFSIDLSWLEWPDFDVASLFDLFD